MSTTGHESEAINVQGLKASLQKLKTNHIDDKAGKSTTLAGYGISDAYTKSETYTKTEVNGLVDTPHQEYVTVEATSQTTAATDVLPNSGQAADTIYRVSNWDGSANSGAGAFDVTCYSEYAWDDVSNPNKYVFLCVKTQIGEVFDISVYNNNAKYANLSAALGVDGANIPQSLRKGGMSVKFVQSSDNKYVQARCMANSFTTDITQWQGVDTGITPNSKNLAESGKVYDVVNGYVKKNITITGIYSQLNIPSSYPYDSIDIVVDLSANVSYLYIDLSTTASGSGITQNIYEGAIVAGKYKFHVPYNNEQWLRIWASGDTPAYPQNSYYSIMAPSVVPDMYMDVTQLKNRTTTAEGNIEELNETVENIELYLYTTDIKDSISLQNGYIDNNGVIKSDASWKYGVYLLKAGLTLTIDSKAAGVGYPTLGIASGATVNVGDFVTLVQGTSYSANEDTYLVINATDVFRHAYLEAHDNILSDYASDNPEANSEKWIKSSKIKELIDNYKVGIGITPAPNINTTAHTLEFDSDSRLFIGNKYYEMPSSVSLDGATSSWGMLYYDIDNNQLNFENYQRFQYVMNSGNKVFLGMLVKNYDEAGVFKGFKYALLPFAYKVDGKFEWDTSDYDEKITDLKIGKDGSGILENNKVSYYNNLLTQANWPSHDHSTVGHNKPLVLLHFSDIHGEKWNFDRIVEFKTYFSSKITDVLCTGDVVLDKFTDSFTYWNDNTILNTIGNHDVLESGVFSHVGVDAYNKYLKPFISNWGVVQPTDAEANGYCYYYKDYTDEGVRLIVLDCMSMQVSLSQGGDTAQYTWLENVLSDAKTKNLAVICADHYPGARGLTRDSQPNSFCSLYDTAGNVDGSTMAHAVDIVQDYIDNGGEFVCWLSGHTHIDFCGTILNTTQYLIAIDCAYCSYDAWNDSDRVRGTKSDDCFNIVSVDTYDKTLKLFRVGVDRDRWLRHKGTMCVKYDTRELLWND